MRQTLPSYNPTLLPRTPNTRKKINLTKIHLEKSGWQKLENLTKFKGLFTKINDKLYYNYLYQNPNVMFGIKCNIMQLIL